MNNFTPYLTHLGYIMGRNLWRTLGLSVFLLLPACKHENSCEKFPSNLSEASNTIIDGLVISDNDLLVSQARAKIIMCYKEKDYFQKDKNLQFLEARKVPSGKTFLLFRYDLIDGYYVVFEISENGSIRKVFHYSPA